jgi:hypothetical protein
VVIVILDTDFGTAGSLGKPGVGFLRTVSQALDGSTIGQFLIKTTVPFVLAVLGPLLPKGRQLADSHRCTPGIWAGGSPRADEMTRR